MTTSELRALMALLGIKSVNLLARRVLTPKERTEWGTETYSYADYGHRIEVWRTQRLKRMSQIIKARRHEE